MTRPRKRDIPVERREITRPSPAERARIKAEFLQRERQRLGLAPLRASEPVRPKGPRWRDEAAVRELQDRYGLSREAALAEVTAHSKSRRAAFVGLSHIIKPTSKRKLTMTYANGSPTRPKSKTLMIEPGWSVDQVSTVEQADLARDILTAGIVAIEESLRASRVDEAAGRPVDTAWFCRAQTALRLKVAALESVQEIKSRLLGDTPERRLLHLVRETDAATYYRALAKAKRLYPNFAL